MSGAVDGDSERRTIAKIFRIESHLEWWARRSRVPRVATVAKRLQGFLTENEALRSTQSALQVSNMLVTASKQK
jgi:hypothetical protein